MSTKTPAGSPQPRNVALLLFFALAMQPAISIAATLVPTKGGVGGYVNVGAGVVTVESNVLASLAEGLVDTSDPLIDDVNEAPGDEAGVIPQVNFELSYTFEESRTQVYLGNLLEDFLTFDLSALAGIRQEVGKAGIVGLALVNTSLATEVWSDPYLTGSDREETDRIASGYRLTWDRVFGSGLELEYSSKEIDIDDERSGVGLGLSPVEQALLDRNGDLNRLEIG